MIYETIISREYIDRGWSGDKKYRVTTRDGGRYLLRVTEPARAPRFALGFKRMEQMEALGIPMCRPIELGECPEGPYAIHSWINGVDAEDLIPTLSHEEQYKYGLDAGRILKKIHSLPAPDDAPEWEERFNAKIDRKIVQYQNCELKYENGEALLHYLSENRRLLAGRPQCLQHGDYHIGNMMVDSNGVLTVIDFDKDDYGDPWEEFNRIVWCVQAAPAFASGLVDGYFDGVVPMDFWKVLALYISSNTLGSLPWAIPFGPEEVETMRTQAAQVLVWYDNMQNVVPNWYHSGEAEIRLYSLSDGDKEPVIDILTNDTVKKTYMLPDFPSRAEAEGLFYRLKELSRQKGRYVRGIYLGETLIGFLNDVEIDGDSVELGWVIHPDHHNKGYATRAVTRAVEELFALGFTEVIAGAFSENPASIRVMEKSGMALLDKTEEIEYRGEVHHCVYYAIRRNL